jgi:hypothetical protein
LLYAVTVAFRHLILLVVPVESQEVARSSHGRHNKKETSHFLVKCELLDPFELFLLVIYRRQFVLFLEPFRIMATTRQALDDLPCPSLISSMRVVLIVAVALVLPSSSWPLPSSTRWCTSRSRTFCFGPDTSLFLHRKKITVLRRDKAFSSRAGGESRCQVRLAAEDADGNDPGGIHFDDFGDQVIGGPDEDERTRSAQGSSLSSQLRTAVQQQENRRHDNWRKGNWHVRGLSLDPESASNVDDLDDASATAAPKIWVCMVAPDPSAQSRVWVGRTDGTLLAVQLGHDFLTSFRSQLSATLDGATGAARVATRLVNDGQRATATGDEEDDDDDDDESVRSEDRSAESPFELQCQASVGSAPVSCVLFGGDEALFSACRNSGTIQQWKITELEDEQLQLDRKATLTGAHGRDSTVIMLKAAQLDRPVLVSVAHDGSVGLWDVASGALLNQCQISAYDDPSHQASFAQSADCDGANLYVGTRQGQVLAYSVCDLLARGRDAAASPSGQWTASVDHAVTAIACGGPGTLGAGRAASSSYPSTTLFTGDAAGAVKQWEVLSRSMGTDGDRAATTKLEPWPKLATQRLQKRAHVFQSMHTDAVTALLPVDSNKVLSASKDGSVVAWNPITGKSYFFMDGFENDIRSLCVQENTLVTDGMKHLVCVHDFDVEEEIDDDEDWNRFEADR